jgi:hypothetical protein
MMTRASSTAVVPCRVPFPSQAKKVFHEGMVAIMRKCMVVQLVCAAQLEKQTRTTLQFSTGERTAATAAARAQIAALADDQVDTWTTRSWTPRHDERLRIMWVAHAAKLREHCPETSVDGDLTFQVRTTLPRAS